MTQAAFQDALAAAEAILAAPPLDRPRLRQALRDCGKARPWEMGLRDLQRLFAVCDQVLGLSAPALPREAAQEEGLGDRLLDLTATDLIEALFIDPGADSRAFVARSLRRTRAMPSWADEGRPTEPVPAVHMAITPAEAAALVRPYLARLEAGMAEAPYAHLKLCWNALEKPVAPFLGVIEDWLADLDRRGLAGGRNVEVMARARALSGLARGGVQVISPAACEAELVPQLRDPHPMIAAAAALYLGAIYADLETFLAGEPPLAELPEILERLRRLPQNRRAVAGGFLLGISDYEDPFGILREALPGFDQDAWVLDVLALGEEEPYLPAAQAFWFFVHEAYWDRADFAMTLIDRGEAWIAMACATEALDQAPQMIPVIERVAREAGGALARDAEDVLARVRAVDKTT